jgi:SPP1 family predicted phage head-tail adaptor
MLTRLQHRIGVQTQTRTEFEGGAYTTSWATSSTIWANVQLQSGKYGMAETYENDKEQQFSYFDVTIRSNSNITNKNRIIFDGKILVIESTNDIVQRGRYQKIQCRLEET